MSGLKAYIKIKVTDKHGKVISETEKPSESFLLGFLNMLEGILRGIAASTTVKDTLGVNEDFPDSSSPAGSILTVNGADDIDGFGIIVGTGTTAPTNADFVIETKINHGVGAGELDYNATGFIATDIVGVNVDVQFNRSFTNSSGGTITVEEVAVYAKAQEDGSTSKYICIIRDLTGGVAVLNTQTLTITYTLRTTV